MAEEPLDSFDADIDEALQTNALEVPEVDEDAIIIEDCIELEIPLKCDLCEETEDKIELLCICPGCGANVFHKSCWGKERFHRPGQLRLGCKQVGLKDFVRIKRLFHSRPSDEEQAQLHTQDIWTTWLGVPQRQNGIHPKLYTYPRLGDILEKAQEIQLRKGNTSSPQSPSLVSFFGETGHGKSTVIRALIRNAAPMVDYPAPIPGIEAHRQYSTSGDVHLYADPQSYDTSTLLLYADCEGLSGTGISLASKASEGIGNFFGVPSRKTFQEQVALHRAKGRSHELRWARTNRHGVLAESKKLIVETLYPRLLYCLSDVVCYVTNSTRATERNLENLFNWACNGHERTLNQIDMPALIIIVNNEVMSPDDQWLDTEHATKHLLEPLKDSANFKELCDEWKRRGRRLKTPMDLILCYYSSVRVICIPKLSDSMTEVISAQFENLAAEIKESSEKLRKTIKDARRGKIFTVELFGQYMNLALTELATDLKSFIDFYYLRKKYRQRPKSFGNHVLALLVKLRSDDEASVERRDDVNEAALIRDFIPFLAFVVASHARHLSGPERQANIERDYRSCRRSLEAFYDSYWRCEKIDEHETGLRCANYKDSHDKGHQFCSESDVWILDEDFESTFDPTPVLDALHSELAQYQDDGDGEQLNLRLLGKIARRSHVNKVTSNVTCFTCLQHSPRYILPCDSNPQHMFCEYCASMFSSPDSTKETLIIRRCPFGCHLADGRAWKIRLKPSMAGARLLALDGGGIRGIVELCILKEILAEVGHGIPLQELFDLAIGTSTGGIIALGLFKMDWSIDEAISKFKTLSKDAFQKRKWFKYTILRYIAPLMYPDKYKSEGIERALHKAFGDGPLFGHESYARSSKADRVRVGVVACTRDGRELFLFSNYARDKHGDDDVLVRAEDPNDELKIWQAARSTSAAPTYFEPYFHKATLRSYVDGALLRNNPVRVLENERRLIWHDETPPDMILSIGTGVKTDTEDELRVPTTGDQIYKKIVPKGLLDKITMGRAVLKSTFDCGLQWNAFVADHTKFARISHRLNLPLSKKPPELDEVAAIEDLEYKVEDYYGKYYDACGTLNYTWAHKYIAHVARQLTAVLFYFKRDGDTGGTLGCRLSSRMPVQFKRLLDSEPSFQVRHFKHVSGSPFEVEFDTGTFSSQPIQLQEYSENHVIEMRLRDWPDKVWERIAGYSAVGCI